jgi:methylphosphotriester-DNA--protein-cysteine methyltransferase
MILHSSIVQNIIGNLIRSGSIVYGGNIQLKIYGTLSCGFGKRLQRSNRVFFNSEQEAVDNGYRPCGHCLKAKYTQWKYDTI